MLNDVLSLCVGLWAVRVAQSGSSKMYTYGWQRAETLGALVNGVFLVALCVTIFLEAIQRFVEKPNVTNPQLVLIVGCVGLASNILGLFLFHDHGHSHGEEGHSHGDEAGEAEAGHTHIHSHETHEHSHTDVQDHAHKHSSPTETSPLMQKTSPAPNFHTPNFSRSDEDSSTLSPNSTATAHRKSVAVGGDHRKSVSAGGEGTYRHRRRTSGFGSVFDIPTHPASFRDNVIQAARYQDDPIEEDSIPEESHEQEDDHDHDHNHDHGHDHEHHSHSNGHVRQPSAANAHKHHNHNQPKDAQSSGGHGHGHGHSHGDLNMRGVFLHVMGDALGNIGVIATALIIWLTKFPGRFYFDPAISLVITFIILWSAIPLCKAASRILLQAVPVGLSIDEIRADIEDLPQVVEAHHLHVWQLSDTKLVASLHVKVDCEVEGSGSASYMKLAREIRACLHGYGIHSSTIQPEFLKKVGSGDLLHNDDEDPIAAAAAANKLPAPGGKASKAGSLLSADGHLAGPGCMMDCEDTCGSQGQCCPSTDGKGQK